MFYKLKTLSRHWRVSNPVENPADGRQDDTIFVILSPPLAPTPMGLSDCARSPRIFWSRFPEGTRDCTTKSTVCSQSAPSLIVVKTGEIHIGKSSYASGFVLLFTVAQHCTSFVVPVDEDEHDRWPANEVDLLEQVYMIA